MNTFLWLSQICLAGIFLYAGVMNLLAFQKSHLRPATGPSFLCVGVPAPASCAIGLAEIVGAVGLLLPLGSQEPYLVAQVSAGALGLLMLAACVHHARRKEQTAPILAVFFLALFVIVGRMR